MWWFQRAQGRGNSLNFRSGRVLGCQADPSFSFFISSFHWHVFIVHIHVQGTVWGTGAIAWNLKSSWGDGAQITRQTFSCLIIIVISAIRLSRIFWGSDERNRPKNGGTDMFTQLDDVEALTRIQVICLPVHYYSQCATAGVLVPWQGSGKRIQH